MHSKLVWKDAPDLGLTVNISSAHGQVLGFLVPAGREGSSADILARVRGDELLSLAALSPDGEAFADLVRAGEIR